MAIDLTSTLAKPLPKGTWVRVRTKNGGETEGVLDEPYVPSFALHIEGATIPWARLASIEEMA